MEDKFVLGGKEFKSRFILGSGKYNLNLIKAAVEQGGAEIITLALRRANTQEKDNILDFIPKGVTLLPNTSGARNAEEAVRIARLSRAMGCGDFVKIEIMRDAKYLFPDNYETVKATEILAKEGLSRDYLFPLIDETAAKVHELPAREAQTGPAIRYDENIINKHLGMLADDPDVQTLYRLLSQSIHKKV